MQKDNLQVDISVKESQEQMPKAVEQSSVEASALKARTHNIDESQQPIQVSQLYSSINDNYADNYEDDGFYNEAGSS